MSGLDSGTVNAVGSCSTGFALCTDYFPEVMHSVVGKGDD